MGAVKAWAMDLEMRAEYIEGWAAFTAGEPRQPPASYAGDAAEAFRLGHQDAYWFGQPDPS